MRSAYDSGWCRKIQQMKSYREEEMNIYALYLMSMTNEPTTTIHPLPQLVSWPATLMGCPTLLCHSCLHKGWTQTWEAMWQTIDPLEEQSKKTSSQVSGQSVGRGCDMGWGSCQAWQLWLWLQLWEYYWESSGGSEGPITEIKGKAKSTLPRISNEVPHRRWRSIFWRTQLS